MECYNIDHDLIEHLKVLQAGNLFWHVVEKVNAVSQVIQVNQHELASWAFYGKESYAEDSPPQHENHAVADGVQISCFNRVVKSPKSSSKKLRFNCLLALIQNVDIEDWNQTDEDKANYPKNH